VMIEMNIPATDVRWVISELRGGSAYAVANAQVLGERVFRADVDLAVKNTGLGLNELAKSSDRPKFFNDEALRISRRLVQLASQSDAGHARLVFGVVSVPVAPSSEALKSNVDALVKGDLPGIGSIEGQLIRVEGSDGSYKIAVFDRLRGRKVPCHIKPDLLKRALEAFDSRVVVRGVVWSRRDGSPARIEVRHFEEMPSGDVIPKWQEMRGILRDFRAADGD
jgi:hypothetical protein